MSLFIRLTYAPYTDDLYDLIAQESLQAFTQSGDRWSVVNPLDSLGEYAEMKNDFPLALRYFEDAFRLSEEVGDQTMSSYMHIHLGRLYRKVGSFDLAIKYHTGYVRLWATMGNQEALKEGFVNLGLDWFSLGRSLGESVRKVHEQRAVMLIAAAEKQRSTPYTFLYDPGLLDQVLTSTRGEWGETEFQRVWKEGQAMSLAEAIAFAMEPLYIQSFQEKMSNHEVYL
jgi:tetratricopeptide (TPR) repeat protein